MIEKAKHILLKAGVLLLLFLFNIQYTYSQCAMCKATVENSENSETFAAGLNSGILYLMAIPYVLFGFIAFMWYKNSRKNKDKRDRIEARINSAKQS